MSVTPVIKNTYTDNVPHVGYPNAGGAVPLTKMPNDPPVEWPVNHIAWNELWDIWYEFKVPPTGGAPANRVDQWDQLKTHMLQTGDVGEDYLLFCSVVNIIPTWTGAQVALYAATIID